MPSDEQWAGTSIWVQSRVPSRKRESTCATCTTRSPRATLRLHGLVGLLADRLQRRAGQPDQVLPRVVPGGVQPEQAAGDVAAVVVALEQLGALEGGEHPRRRGLGQVAGLLEVREGERLVGLDDRGDQQGGAVDRLGAARRRFGHRGSSVDLSAKVPHDGTTVPHDEARIPIRAGQASDPHCRPQEGPMFVNRMPRYEILSEDAMATLETGWRRLMTEIGVEFMDDRALDLFRKAGQKVEDNDGLPRPRLRARAGGQGAAGVRPPGPQPRQHACTSAATRWPSARSTARRSSARATYAATARWRTSATSARLAQSFSVLDSAGGVVNEPNDTPLDSRHLDMVYALQTLTDKIYMGNVVSGVNAARHDRDDRDPVRLPRGDRGDAGDHLADQLQLARCAGTTGCSRRSSSTPRPTSRSCSRRSS